MPEVHSEADFEMIKSLVLEMYEETDEKLLRDFCAFASLEISPLSVLLGGIMAFEVVKFTGLYLPMKEFFYLDFFDCVQKHHEEERFETSDPFYDSKTIFGKEMINKLSSLKYFFRESIINSKT